MIVPLEVKIEPIVRPEDYDVDQVVEFGKSIPGPPVYRVLAVALDTESDTVKTYDLHTLVDRSQDPPRIATITHSPLEDNRKYLTKLRDQLNEVLAPSGTASIDREHFLAEQLRSMAQTMTELQGDEFHYLCEAAELLAEIGDVS